MPFSLNRREKSTPRRRGQQVVAAAIEELESRQLLTIALPQTYSAADLPKQIVGNSTISSSLDISGVQNTITDINVKVNLVHPNDGNLTLTLESPQGTFITLSGQAGGTGDNFTNTVFDDEATSYVDFSQAPFSGSFKPTQALTLLKGEQVDGTWKLMVNDSRIGETGTLLGFSVIITAGGTTQTYSNIDGGDIPDPGTLTQPITVSNMPGLINDVNVRMTITHPNDGDLTVTLISPTGTRVPLVDAIGGTGDGFINTRFDDYADDFIDDPFLSAPYVGVFRPLGGLASFQGEDPNGNWQLEVVDNTAGGAGKLVSWQLTITTSDGTGGIQGYVWNDLDRDGQRPSTVINGVNPNVMYVIDLSSSTELPFNGSPIGDVNNDGFADTVLDGELAGFIALTNSLNASGFGNAIVSVDIFADTARVLDMQPTVPGYQDSLAVNTDANNNGILDVVEILQSIQEDPNGIGSTTSYADGLQAAVLTFQALGTLPGEGNLIFISDGAPNPDPNGGTPQSLYQPFVTQLTNMGVAMHAYGAGPDASLPALQVIDPNAAIFATTDELIDTFSGTGGLANFTEPGLANWTVYLDLNSNGQRDPGEPSTVTNTAGTYRFFDIPAGTYTVREVVQPNYGVSTPVGGSQDVTLAVGQVQKQVNFGDFQSHGTVSGYLWNDVNGDSVRETDLLSGTTPDVVFIVDASASSLQTIDGTAVGDLNNDGAANTILDAEIAAYTAAVNNLVARGVGFTSRISIIAYGDTATFMDFSGPTGNVQSWLRPASDGNGNGVYDAIDALENIRPIQMNLGASSNYKAALGLADQVFGVMGTTAGEGSLVLMAAAPPPGAVSFSAELTSLAAKGIYNRAFAVGASSFAELQQIDPAASGFVTTDPLVANFAGTADGISVHYVEPGLVGATVFLDANNNGIPDAGEAVMVTDATGAFDFTDISAGAYTLSQVVPNGYVATSPSTGNIAINLTDGALLSNQNLADGIPAVIAGSVWNDINPNGEYDNEPLIQGVTVYVDSNNNGSFDEGEPSAVTDGGGNWEIDNLPAGHYFIREILPDGYIFGTPTDGSYEATLESGSNIDTFDFADIVPVPQIPDLDVKGVPDGSRSAKGVQNFGTVHIGGHSTRTFVLRNTGNGDLRLNGSHRISIGGKYASSFKIINRPINVFFPGASDGLKISFAPKKAGNMTATVTILSNDPDERPYTFVIRGKALAKNRKVAPKAQASAKAAAGTGFAQASVFNWASSILGGKDGNVWD